MKWCTSISTLYQIDKICNEFEETWSCNRPFNAWPYLRQIEKKYRYRLLQELLEVDLELRRRRGWQVAMDDYYQMRELALSIAKALSQ